MQSNLPYVGVLLHNNCFVHVLIACAIHYFTKVALCNVTATAISVHNLFTCKIKVWHVESNFDIVRFEALMATVPL
jgi:hypothetical protein